MSLQLNWFMLSVNIDDSSTVIEPDINSWFQERSSFKFLYFYLVTKSPFCSAPGQRFCQVAVYSSIQIMWLLQGALNFQQDQVDTIPCTLEIVLISTHAAFVGLESKSYLVILALVFATSKRSVSAQSFLALMLNSKLLKYNYF